MLDLLLQFITSCVWQQSAVAMNCIKRLLCCIYEFKINTYITYIHNTEMNAWHTAEIFENGGRKNDCPALRKKKKSLSILAVDSSSCQSDTYTWAFT